MTLLEKIIDTFDGEIMVDNEWRVNGTNGKHYTVKWDPYHKNYSCQCKCFIYRKSFRHITELSNSFRREFHARHN